MAADSTGLPTSVDVQAMQRAEPIFQNAYSEVSAVLSNMDEQQGMLQANWVGETASAFGQALSAWLGDMQAVQTALANIIDTMGQTTGVYVNTDATSTQVQAAFTSGINELSGLSGLTL
jgi:WXG100 family type VII secretion target